MKFNEMKLRSNKQNCSDVPSRAAIGYPSLSYCDCLQKEFALTDFFCLLFSNLWDFKLRISLMVG